MRELKEKKFIFAMIIFLGIGISGLIASAIIEHTQSQKTKNNSEQQKILDQVRIKQPIYIHDATVTLDWTKAPRGYMRINPSIEKKIDLILRRLEHCGDDLDVAAKK